MTSTLWSKIIYTHHRLLNVSFEVYKNSCSMIVCIYGMFAETLFECTVTKKLSNMYSVVTDYFHTPLIAECKEGSVQKFL